jgi:hypothetical protein
LPNKYLLGGPRLPKTFIMMIVPVLQQGHLRSSVFAGCSGRSICKLACNICSFPLFCDRNELKQLLAL